MLIKKLTLKDNKRLLLNNIREIVIEPNSPLQLILGTNGSGKSTLLREFSPLPGSPSDYTKDGSKTIELEENNNKYLLTSTFKNGNKHTFIRNDEVLNDEGTAMVQKELIEKYFSYTQEIHYLLTGDVKLTDMGPQKRREWFTKLSPNSLTYAIEVYNALKARLRDTQGAQAHVNKRLTAETNRLLSLTDVDNIDARVELLKTDLVLLLENKDARFNNPDEMEREIYKLMDYMDEQSKNILNRKFSPLLGNFSSLEELEARCNLLNSEYQVSLNSLKMKTSEYVDMENLMESIRRADADGIEGIIKKKKDLELNAMVLSNKLRLFKSFANIESIVVQNDYVLSLAEGILQILPSNEEGYFSKAKISEVEASLNKVKEKIFGLRMNKSRAEERYEYVEAAKDIECPNCKYVWKPGISEHELESLRLTIEKLDHELVDQDEDLKNATDYLEKAEEYISLWKKFKNIVDANPIFLPLWDYLLENKLVINSPKKAVSILYVWKEDTEIVNQLFQMEKEGKTIQAAFDAVSTIESISGIGAFKNKIQELNEEIEFLTFDGILKKEAFDNLTTIYEDTKKLLIDYSNLEKTLERLEFLHLEYEKGLKNTIINNAVVELNTTLGQIQNKLNEKITLENLINDLSNDIAVLDLDYTGYKILMDELSPVNGLIADQLYGNIQCIVSQMNEIISQVWTYELEIKSCGLESNDLDYKFPLAVKGSDEPAPDIADGSDGQLEIINFAFKLVVMLYLNLNNNPLYLDETGRDLDEQHRVNLMNYIKLLVDTKRHSQLFMVSHYAPQYGAMTQAEVCVLDSSNIATPMTHNKHVSIR